MGRGRTKAAPTRRRAGRLEAEATEHAPAREYLTADEIYARRRRDVEHAQGKFRAYLSGTLHATYLAFMRAATTAAAAALAHDPRFLTFSFASPEAAKALRMLRREEGNREAARMLREDVFVEAIRQAQADSTQPQPMRLRGHYLKTRDELVVPFAPADLPLDFHQDWLRKEAYRIAEARLVSMLVDPLPPDDILAEGRLTNPLDCGLENLVDLKDAGENVLAIDTIAVSRALDDILAEAEDLGDHLRAEPEPERRARPRDQVVLAMTAEGHTAAEIAHAVGLKTTNAVYALRRRIREGRRPRP
jgi:hypothetical protein